MKIKSFILALCALAVSIQASAFDLNSLKNLNLGGVINSLISTDKVEVTDLTGTWVVTGPAVVFKSENLLQKAGGTAAEATIESKLAPYYERAGVNGLQLTFDGSENFVMTFKNGRTISGTVTKGSTDGTLVFNFSALGSTKLKSVTAYVSKGTQLSLTFDISKLSNIISAAAKYTNNRTVSTVSSLLSSYKGIYCGFKLQQQN